MSTILSIFAVLFVVCVIVNSGRLVLGKSTEALPRWFYLIYVILGCGTVIWYLTDCHQVIVVIAGVVGTVILTSVQLYRFNTYGLTDK